MSRLYLGGISYFTSPITRDALVNMSRVRRAQIIHFIQILCQAFDIWDGCLNQPYLSTIFSYLSACFPESRSTLLVHIIPGARLAAIWAACIHTQIHWSHLAARAHTMIKSGKIFYKTLRFWSHARRGRVHTNASNKRDAIEAHKYTADLLRVIHFSTDSVNVC